MGQRVDPARTVHGRHRGAALVQTQAQGWTEHANLRFEFQQCAGRGDPHSQHDQSDGAWSNVGTDCLSVPRNQPTMNLGFLDGGTAAHDSGHTIGLGHEHQNPAGGLQWNEGWSFATSAARPILDAAASPL